MRPEETAPAYLPPKSSANAPPRYEYGPRTQNAIAPMMTTARSDPEVVGGRSVSASSATAAARNPKNITVERPFSPMRSLSQPDNNTEITPTAGNTALIPAAALSL